jgi:hypothetical protein
MTKGDRCLLADEALQPSPSEGPMKIEDGWCVRVRMQGERVGRSRMINRKSVSKGTVQAPFWSLSIEGA